MIELINFWWFIFSLTLAGLVAWLLHPFFSKWLKALLSTFEVNIMTNEVTSGVKPFSTFLLIAAGSIFFIIGAWLAATRLSAKPVPPAPAAILQEFRAYEKNRADYFFGPEWRNFHLNQNDNWQPSELKFSAGDYVWAISYDSCYIKIEPFNGDPPIIEKFAGSLYQKRLPQEAAVYFHVPLVQLPYYDKTLHNVWVKKWSFTKVQTDRARALVGSLFCMFVGFLLLPFGMAEAAKQTPKSKQPESGVDIKDDVFSKNQEAEMDPEKNPNMSIESIMQNLQKHASAGNVGVFGYAWKQSIMRFRTAQQTRNLAEMQKHFEQLSKLYETLNGAQQHQRKFNRFMKTSKIEEEIEDLKLKIEREELQQQYKQTKQGGISEKDHKRATLSKYVIQLQKTTLAAYKEQFQDEGLASQYPRFVDEAIQRAANIEQFLEAMVESNISHAEFERLIKAMLVEHDEEQSGAEKKAQETEQALKKREAVKKVIEEQIKEERKKFFEKKEWLEYIKSGPPSENKNRDIAQTDSEIKTLEQEIQALEQKRRGMSG